MRLIISGKSYDVDPDRLLNTEAIAIEKETGLTVRDLIEGARRMSMLALTALVWVAMKRETPALRMSDVVFRLDDLEAEDDQSDDEEVEDEEVGGQGDDPKDGSAEPPPVNS